MKTSEYNNGRNKCMTGNDNLEYDNINHGKKIRLNLRDKPCKIMKR